MASRPCVLLTAALGIVGCRESPRTSSAVSVDQSAPSYAADVAPILAAHCAPCHRPEQGAPFLLLTYADAKARATAIARAVEARHMPPWLPDPGEPAFVGERRLPVRDIQVLRRWADTGAVEGDTRAVPPVRPAASGAQGGEPDLVLRPARAYALAPGREDVFRNLVIRTQLGTDRYVRAVEFRPGDAPVHHAVVHLDATAGSRQRDGGDGQPGFDGMGGMGAQEPEGHFVGWAPGRGPIVSAEGMPWRLSPGTDLVLELHLIPRKAPVSVQPTVALYLSETPPKAMPMMIKMGARTIDIPPGATDYAVTDRYLLPVDVQVLSLYPHAHYLGKDMDVHAILPGGSTRTLLRIREWSFHWQQDYRFSTPVSLPRGTTVVMRFTYDNSDANEDNPHHPPVRVLAGQRSTDEMANLLVQAVPGSWADRATLERSIAARDAAANVETAEQRVRANPNDPAGLTFLGASYVDVGRVDDGIRTLELALRLDPASWKSHNEMGGALVKAGRPADAVPHFQRATRLKPDDAFLHFNLAKALTTAGAAEAAQASFVRALALNPRFAEAHNELGVWLFARGRVDEAIAHLRQAVALAPNSAVAHSDLGGALAQAGRREEALAHLRQALVLDPGNQAAAENLARLQRGR